MEIIEFGIQAPGENDWAKNGWEVISTNARILVDVAKLVNSVVHPQPGPPITPQSYFDPAQSVLSVQKIGNVAFFQGYVTPRISKGAGNVRICLLPEGFRPVKNTAGVAAVAGTACAVRVASNGGVEIVTTTNTGTTPIFLSVPPFKAH